MFDFVFSSLVSVHIMVFNFTSFYFCWCFFFLLFESSEVGLKELSALTWEDSNGNIFKQVSAPNLTLIHTKYFNFGFYLLFFSKFPHNGV